jgi:hypothetical protein
MGTPGPQGLYYQPIYMYKFECTLSRIQHRYINYGSSGRGPEVLHIWTMDTVPIAPVKLQWLQFLNLKAPVLTLKIQFY